MKYIARPQTLIFCIASAIMAIFGFLPSLVIPIAGTIGLVSVMGRDFEGIVEKTGRPGSAVFPMMVFLSALLSFGFVFALKSIT